MDVGRQEFGVLSLVEIGFAIVTLALATLARPSRRVWTRARGRGADRGALQALWLLPVLDARAETIIQGGTPPSAPWHALYIVAEVLKLLALLAAGWLALWTRRHPDPSRPPEIG